MKVKYCYIHDLYYEMKRCPLCEYEKIRNWSFIAKYNLKIRLWGWCNW